MDSNKKVRFVAKKLSRELRKKSTNAEKILWNTVRSRKLNNCKISRQVPIFYDFKGIEKFFIADFYCHEKKLVIEVDGGYHKTQKEYDKSRSEIINLLGIKVIRFTNNEVEKSLLEVIGIILDELK